MAQPAHSALSGQGVHAGNASVGQNLRVGHSLLPGYTQDMADASQVEGGVPSLLSSIGGRCLAAVQQFADDTLVVHCHLCFHR